MELPFFNTASRKFSGKLVVANANLHYNVWQSSVDYLGYILLKTTMPDASAMWTKNTKENHLKYKFFNLREYNTN